MHFSLLDSDSIRKLLTRKSDEADTASDYGVCSVGDYFRQTESIKKSENSDAALDLICSRATMLHKRIDDGTIYMPALELRTLQFAFFEDEDFYREPRLHVGIATADVPPESTVSMLVLRQFDRDFDTGLFDEYCRYTSE